MRFNGLEVLDFRILRHTVEHDIVTLQLNAGIMEEEADTRQWCAKHASEAKNQHANEVLLQAVFSIRSAPKLYNEQLG
jgi:hypothetical protein